MARKRKNHTPPLPDLVVVPTPREFARGVALVTAYEQDGELCFEPGEGDARPVHVALADGVHLARGRGGALFVFRHGYLSGVTLKDAFALGWCWLPAPEPTAPAQDHVGPAENPPGDPDPRSRPGGHSR